MKFNDLSQLVLGVRIGAYFAVRGLIYFLELRYKILFNLGKFPDSEINNVHFVFSRQTAVLYFHTFTVLSKRLHKSCLQKACMNVSQLA